MPVITQCARCPQPIMHNHRFEIIRVDDGTVYHNHVNCIDSCAGYYTPTMKQNVSPTGTMTKFAGNGV